MNKDRKNIVFLLAYFFISLFVFRNLLISPGFIGMRDDWIMPPYSSQYIGQAKKMLYAWSSNFTGVNYIRTFGDYPYMIFGFLASIFGFGGEFFTKAILVVTMTLSGFFLFLLLKDFKMKNMSAFVGSLLYMLSPMFYNATVSGYFVFLISYCLLPLFFLLFKQIIETKGKIPLEKILLSGLILRLIIGQDNFIFITPILLGLYYIFDFILRKKGIKYFLQDVKNLLPVALIAMLLSLSSFINIFTSFEESFGLVSEGLESWNVGAAPQFFNSFFLDGAGYRYFLLSVPKDAYFVWMLFATIVLMLIFSSLIFIKKDKYLIFFSLLSLFFIFLFKGDNPPFGGVYRFVFENISIMKVAFRNIQYLTVFVSVGYAYMLGRTLDILQESLKSKASAYSIILGHTILVIVVFELPFMTGRMSGHIQTVELDSVYEKLVKQTEEDPSDTRTLWLPISQPIAYKKKRLSGLDPLFVGSSKGFVINDGAGLLDRTLSEEIYTTKNPDSIKYLLAVLNVDKVILRSDFYSHHPDFMTHGFWRKNNFLWNNRTLRENLSQIADLTLLEEVGPTKIYKNEFFAPHFYVPNTHVGIGGKLTDFTKVAEIGNYGPLTSYKFISDASEGHKNSVNDLYFMPTSISDNLPSMVYSTRQFSSDVSWAWPNCSVSPVNVAYKGVLVKEDILSFGKNEPEDKLENLVWLAAKRICEIDIYYDELSESSVEGLITQFLEGFNEAYKIVFEIKENPWKDYLMIARKLAYYYEKSLSVLINKIPGAIQRDDIKSLYWDLYSLGLAETRDIEGRILIYDYNFSIKRHGIYDLYSDLGINGEIDIFNSKGSKIGSTSISGGNFEERGTRVWKKIYSDLDVSETGDTKISVSAQKGNNLAETRETILKDLAVGSNVVPIATATEWETASDYLVSFDYSFGAGDFIAIFKEEVPKIKYYRYGDGFFDWFDYASEEIYWEDFEIFYREFRNSLNFDKSALESLGACVYWEGDICYRRFSSLVNSNAVSRNPLLFIQGISETERQDLGNLSIKNVQIIKVTPPSLVLADSGHNVSTSSESAVKISHRKINQSKYEVTLQSYEKGKDFKLVFSEGFNNKWKIYIKNTDNKGILAGIFEKITGDPKPFETLGNKSLFTNTHERVNSYANLWAIDTSEFDGKELPITLVVEFGPQKAHYIWVFISLVSFLLICFYLIRESIKKMYDKR